MIRSGNDVPRVADIEQVLKVGTYALVRMPQGKEGAGDPASGRPHPAAFYNILPHAAWALTLCWRVSLR